MKAIQKSTNFHPFSCTILLFRYLCSMKLFRNPLVWLRRVRHRRGYGVQSPSAYAFVRGVLLERGSYYAYSELSLLHPLWQRLLHTYSISCCRLLFRIANAVHPATLAICGDCPLERRYITAAVPSAAIRDYASTAMLKPDETVDFCFISNSRITEATTWAEHISPYGALVIEGIYDSSVARRQWKAVKASEHVVTTYDLYVYGIALFDASKTPFNYVVSF